MARYARWVFWLAVLSLGCGEAVTAPCPLVATGTWDRAPDDTIYVGYCEREWRMP